MNDNAAQLFEEHRPFLTKLAYRISGNWTDSEDLVSQAFVRWSGVDLDTVENPRAFLATILTRLAINHRASARVRLEIAIDPQDVTRLKDQVSDDVTGLSDALTAAFEIVLSRLSPTERAVFLLREVFQMEYAEIASLLDESEANCRQILKRARQRIDSPQGRFPIQPDVSELALERFLNASRDGKIEELMDIVAPGVVLMRDAGDIGLPSPAPLFGATSVLDHVRDYLARKGEMAWSCFRIGNGYQVAMLSGAGKPLSAIISAVDQQQQKLTRIDHITCPTRLLMLSKLVGTAG